jgi:hypothetical protein
MSAEVRAKGRATLSDPGYQAFHTPHLFSRAV